MENKANNVDSSTVKCVQCFHPVTAYIPTFIKSIRDHQYNSGRKYRTLKLNWIHALSPYHGIGDVLSPRSSPSCSQPDTHIRRRPPAESWGSPTPRWSSSFSLCWGRGLHSPASRWSPGLGWSGHRAGIREIRFRASQREPQMAQCSTNGCAMHSWLLRVHFNFQCTINNYATTTKYTKITNINNKHLQLCFLLFIRTLSIL